MPRKIIAFLICFCLIFEQAGFAQVASQPGGVPLYLSAVAPAADRFRPIHLRSITIDPRAEEVDVLLDRGDAAKVQPQEITDATKKLMEYFRIGLALPNSMFWVNLRPDAPQEIIDPYLEKTDLGKVLLETDLQLKKDLAKFSDPNTAEGKQYWDKLYAKAEQLYGSGDIEIPTVTRPWIVPGEIIIGESANSAYIYKATLNVMLEQDYLKDSVQFSFDDERSREMNEYSSQLVRELIIPKLTRHVNASKQYASLRQVYYSLILAQWFKARNAGKEGVYARQINTRDLSGLTSQKAWSKDACFKAYQRSFTQGEYNREENVFSYNGMAVRRYFSGGAALTNIIPSFTRTAIPPTSLPLPNTISKKVPILYEGVAIPNSQAKTSRLDGGAEEELAKLEQQKKLLRNKVLQLNDLLRRRTTGLSQIHIPRPSQTEAHNALNKELEEEIKAIENKIHQLDDRMQQLRGLDFIMQGIPADELTKFIRAIVAVNKGDVHSVSHSLAITVNTRDSENNITKTKTVKLEFDFSKNIVKIDGTAYRVRFVAGQRFTILGNILIQEETAGTVVETSLASKIAPGLGFIGSNQLIENLTLEIGFMVLYNHRTRAYRIAYEDVENGLVLNIHSEKFIDSAEHDMLRKVVSVTTFIEPGEQWPLGPDEEIVAEGHFHPRADEVLSAQDVETFVRRAQKNKRVIPEIIATVMSEEDVQKIVGERNAEEIKVVQEDAQFVPKKYLVLTLYGCEYSQMPNLVENYNNLVKKGEPPDKEFLSKSMTVQHWFKKLPKDGGTPEIKKVEIKNGQINVYGQDNRYLGSVNVFQGSPLRYDLAQGYKEMILIDFAGVSIPEDVLSDREFIHNLVKIALYAQPKLNIKQPLDTAEIQGLIALGLVNMLEDDYTRNSKYAAVVRVGKEDFKILGSIHDDQPQFFRARPYVSHWLEALVHFTRQGKGEGKTLQLSIKTDKGSKKVGVEEYAVNRVFEELYRMRQQPGQRALSEFDGGKESVVSAPGGIDLRALPIAARPVEAAAGTANQIQPAVSDPAVLAQLKQQWGQIELSMQKGPLPYKDIRQYIDVCRKQGAQEAIDEVFVCIAKLLRMEEDLAVATPAELKEILVLLG